MKSGELIHRYLVGIASDDDVHELECRLKGDEQLQDELLLQAEIDAWLRQEVYEVVTTNDEPTDARVISSKIWKWASGISVLAATILLAFFVSSFPQQEVLAHPSIGQLTINVKWGEQNIWAAAGRGDVASLRRELQKTPLDARLDGELTALHLTALFNQKRAAEFLLSRGANVSLTDAEGNTALHMAAFLGHTDVVRTLLKSEADPAVRNQLGFNAMDLVAVAWSSNLEDYYHEVETKLNTTLDLEQIRAARPKILNLLAVSSDASASTEPSVSIWKAATTGNTAAIQQHIAVGSDLNAREEIGGSTPLILAAIFGQPDIAKSLIDAGADLEARNNSGGTALHLASFFCQPEVVEILLQAGADTSKTNSHGLSPLGVVSGEWNSELEGIYQHVYGSLNLTFDSEHVRNTREEISEILKRYAAAEAGAQRQERQGATK